MALGGIETRIDEDTDDQRGPSKELTVRAARNHAAESFPPGRQRTSASGAKIATVVEHAARLREALVSYLESAGILHLPSVAAAMRAVPRHRFIPGATAEEAYADRAIAIKLHDGNVISSISQPGMIAQMLELLDPQSGDRVLEIGTGSGYNAALLAEIVRPGGRVTTVDLDPELAGRAAALLLELGYDNVRVLAEDGTRLHDRASYDRIVVTARTDDIAAAWWDGLREGARLVAPLLFEGAGEYAVGFVRRGNRLLGIGAHPCAFIALRGDGETPACGDVFYRDPAQRARVACLRRLAHVVALRHEDATPELLSQADIVVARPVTIFALTLLPS
jgi:protein-L-isoaspartate(D-aspartate) O-methyltransferase